MEYEIKVNEVKKGTRIQFGDGYGCLKPNAIRVVNSSKDGLWVKCKEGKHYIDGNIEDDKYINMKLAE